jgi:hypothetical protein
MHRKHLRHISSDSRYSTSSGENLRGLSSIIFLYSLKLTILYRHVVASFPALFIRTADDAGIWFHGPVPLTGIAKPAQHHPLNNHRR